MDAINSFMSGVGFAWPNCSKTVKSGRNACNYREAAYFMVTEEGIGNVCIYPYRSRNEANEGMDFGLFGFAVPSRILFNEKCDELASAGPGAPHNTIRKGFRDWLGSVIKEMLGRVRREE